MTGVQTCALPISDIEDDRENLAGRRERDVQIGSIAFVEGACVFGIGRQHRSEGCGDCLCATGKTGAVLDRAHGLHAVARRSGHDRCERLVSLDVTEIEIHEADEPTAVVFFTDADELLPKRVA